MGVTLAQRVLDRVASGNVTIKVDIPATLQARKRWPTFEGLIVGEFDSQMTLYRVFDGEEMARILQTGKITGGKYAVPAERVMGASWAHDISSVIRFGNNARGKRLGQKIYVAKLDATGMQFLHLGPGVELDPSADEQTVSIPKQTCNLGLGCSVANVDVRDIDAFFEVTPDDQIHRVSLRDLKAGEPMPERVAARVMTAKSYFQLGDIVLYGKYKNKRGKIVKFDTDKWGNPTVEIEPIPKGRKQNKIFGLYKMWRADVKENVLKKQQAEEAAQAKNEGKLASRVAERVNRAELFATLLGNDS